MLGDMLRLEQVLVNLISNAMQAMEGLAAPRIEITAGRQGSMMSIAVRDFGPGVPESDLEKVFEPFYTTKLDKQGLGLGLSISHRIILSMGGQLTVTNHPEGGACVYGTAAGCAFLRSGVILSGQISGLRRGRE